MKSVKMMMSENQLSQQQVFFVMFKANNKSMWQCFSVLRVKSQTDRLIGDQVPLPAEGGGGVRFWPNTSPVLRKWKVNATLIMGHQADLAHCNKFHILQRIFSTQYLYCYFGTGEDDE